MPTPLSRRTALGGVATATVLVATGCTPKGIDRRPKAGATASASPTRARGTDPDVALAAAVLADEQGALDLVAATLERHPRLESVLAAVRTTHQAHVDLLNDAVPDDARVSPSGSPSSTVSPSVTPSPSMSASASASASPSASASAAPPVPRRPGPALSALSDAEDRLALVARRSAFAAESGAFARVLASMGASASQHTVTLAAAAQDRR